MLTVHVHTYRDTFVFLSASCFLNLHSVYPRQTISAQNTNVKYLAKEASVLEETLLNVATSIAVPY